MANQCVQVITKSTQCPVVFVGISVTKFVPSKESGSFVKFFKNTKPKGEEVVILDSLGDPTNSMSNSGTKAEMSFNDKEVCSLKSVTQKPKKTKESSAVKELIGNTNEGTMRESKKIVNNLNTSAEDSPVSKRVSKLIQVCNEREKARTKNKRLSGLVNTDDFQVSFFMNVYKTGEKKFNNIDGSGDTVEESKCKKQLIMSNADEKNIDDENIDDCNIDLRIQGNACEAPFTSNVHIRVNNNKKPVSNESNEKTSAQDPSVRLREIFPDLDDIDPNILSLLPADLQEEAKSYMKARDRKQENVKIARELPKTGRGRPCKGKVAGKSGKRRSPLYNFLIKINSDEHDVPLERCAECDQMIPVTKFSEHLDFHVAQNLYQEINKPLGENGGTKRKLEDDKVAVTSTKRQTSNIREPDWESRSTTTFLS